MRHNIAWLIDESMFEHIEVSGHGVGTGRAAGEGYVYQYGMRMGVGELREGV